MLLDLHSDAFLLLGELYIQLLDSGINLYNWSSCIFYKQRIIMKPKLFAFVFLNNSEAAEC